jgi:NAD(P)-dependent dehydrogenase (short-subunit alcohol dehydrogenase family)
MAYDKDFDLDGRVALITGASRGIGEAIARKLAAHGAHVIITSRKIDSCREVVESIRDDGGAATAAACHIGHIDQIEKTMELIKEEHGKLDILVNNAATNPYFGPIEGTDLGVFEKTVEVNIRGYFFMSTHAVKLMKQQDDGGTILNVASINGVIPGFYQGIYSITKAAIISMTKSFAKEMGPHGIRVNGLLPGLTDTKFAAALTQNESMKEGIMPHIPMSRVAEPEEMAGAALYLVSDAASYTTGACLNVDGGYLTA